MITDDQAARLFAAANPIPSLDLLDPIDAMTVTHRVDGLERSRPMVQVDEIPAEQESPNRKPRRGPVVTLVLAGVALLVAIPLIVNRGDVVGGDDPVETATAFMDAFVAHDGAAAAALFAPDGSFYTVELSELPALQDWYAAVGWQFTNESCDEVTTGEVGTLVHCDYTFENDFTRAVGSDPVTGTFILLVDEDGEILNANEEFNFNDYGDIWVQQIEFFTEEYPDDADAMFNDDFTYPALDAESIRLWDRHTDDFVAEFSG